MREEMWRRAQERLWQEAILEASQGIWCKGLFELKYMEAYQEIYG